MLSDKTSENEKLLALTDVQIEKFHSIIHKHKACINNTNNTYIVNIILCIRHPQKTYCKEINKNFFR